ncbi:MAG: hypothetical protein ACOX29_10365 [Bacillota bacterium]
MASKSTVGLGVLRRLLGKFGPALETHPEWRELDEAGRPFSNWEYQTRLVQCCPS